MMYGRGFYNNFNCFRYFNSPWHWLIGLTIITIIFILIYKLIKKNKNDSLLEDLKIKLVSGEISENEYKIKKENLLR